MNNNTSIPVSKRILAFGCTVCPFCIARRIWPGSAYARIMGRIEQNCPFCRAYDEIRSQKNSNSAGNREV